MQRALLFKILKSMGNFWRGTKAKTRGNRGHGVCCPHVVPSMINPPKKRDLTGEKNIKIVLFLTFSSKLWSAFETTRLCEMQTLFFKFAGAEVCINISSSILLFLPPSLTDWIVYMRKLYFKSSFTFYSSCSFYFLLCITLSVCHVHECCRFM